MTSDLSELEEGEIKDGGNDDDRSRRLWAFERPPAEYQRIRFHPILSAGGNVDGCSQHTAVKLRRDGVIQTFGTTDQATQTDDAEYFHTKRRKRRRRRLPPQLGWNRWFRPIRRWSKECDVVRRQWERERETQTRPGMGQVRH